MKYPQTVSEARKILGLSPDGPATIPVAEAGRRAYGLSYNRSYEAAKKGAFTVIDVAGRKHVPVIPLAMRMIAERDGDGNPPAAA